MKKYLIGLLVLSMIVGGVVGVNAFTDDWDAAFEAIPPDSELALYGASRIRALKRDIRERLDEEHSYGDIVTTDTGVHLEGSARIWVQDAAPTTTPGGLALDDGCMWFETDALKLYYYNLSEAAWVYIIEKGDWASLSEDNVFAGTNTFADIIADQFKFTVLEITSNETADADETFYNIDATAADVTLTLPPLTGLDGRAYFIRKSDSSDNSAIVDADGSETINGSATFTMTIPNDSIILLSNGTEWKTFGQVPPLGLAEAQLTADVADRLNRYTIFSEFGGDGGDGDYAITSNTSLSGSGVLYKEYDDLSITSGAELTVDDGVFCLIIGVKGTLTMDNGASISMDGKGAVANSTGATGGAGLDGDFGGYGLVTAYTRLIPSTWNLAGGGGGAGGGHNAAGGDGGAAGTAGTGGGASPSVNASAHATDISEIGTTTNQRILFQDNKDIKRFLLRAGMYSFGGGGGEGGCNGGNDCSDGGNGGGFLYIEANDISLTGTPDLSADGADGTVANDSGSIRSGAGGGGGGGTIIVYYKTTNAALSRTAAGGSGGAAGVTYGGAGGDGGDGSHFYNDVN